MTTTMTKTTMTEKQSYAAYLKDAVERSAKAMTESDIFTVLLTKAYMKDPVACAQLGLAIVLDKPMYILALDGVEIPENIRRLARHIEPVASLDDVGLATRRLLARATADGVIAPSASQ